MQDIVSILVLASLSGIEKLPAILLLIGIAIPLRKMFNHIIGKSPDLELLVIGGISYMLFMCYFSHLFGIPVEAGALLAGISLADYPFALELSSRVKAISEFFLVAFFLYIGSKITFASVSIPLLIATALLLVIGTPLVIVPLLKFFGYTLRTAVKSACLSLSN